MLQMKRTCLQISSLLMLCFLCTNEISASNKFTQIAEPEIEIQRALTTLENLNKQIDVASKVNSAHIIGPQNILARRSFENAKKLFRAGEYLSAAREISTYLNLTQVPEAGPYLDAHFILGRSYEAIGMDLRASKTYARYVATFITQRESKYGRLLEVLQRLLSLAAKSSNSKQMGLDQLLSSVTSLNMPKAQKAETLYYAASSAYNSGNTSLASSWFNKANKLSEDAAIQSRARYFAALISLNNGDFSKAETLFRENLASKSKAGSEFRDRSRLALARVAVKQKRPKLALIHYSKIATNSPVYQSSLFEMMYLNLEQGMTDTALTQGKEYLQKFPTGKDSFQVKTLLGYLDLKAGKLSEARSNINDSNNDLKKYKQWVNAGRFRKDHMTHDDAKSLIEFSESRVSQSPQLMQAYKIFGSIAELKRRLADNRSNIRNLIYTMGRANIKQFQPEWVERSNQLETISEETLEVGHKLVDSLKNLLGKSISATDKYALTALADRRKRLLSKPAVLRRKSEMWAGWANAITLTQDIAAKQQQLRELRSKINAAGMLNKSINQESPNNTRASLSQLSQRATQLEASLNRSLEQLRTKKILDLIKQGPHRAARKFHRQYANLLHEEASILQKHLSRYQKPSHRYVAEDSQSAWNRWVYVSKNIYNHLDELDNSINQDLSTLIKNIGKYTETNDHIKRKLNKIQNNLEVLMGKSLTTVLSEYNRNINQRMAKHQKWQADMDWIEYNKATEEKEAASKQFELEKQMLKDNLEDLQQGVLWQWPNN